MKSEGEIDFGQDKAPKRTLNMLYKDLKRPTKKKDLIDEDEVGEISGDDDGDDDCGADSDDLDAKDMKHVHGDILNAIKQFD
jgi:hypothetical protein